jgi:hypothetical protein
MQRQYNEHVRQRCWPCLHRTMFLFPLVAVQGKLDLLDTGKSPRIDIVMLGYMQKNRDKTSNSKSFPVFLVDATDDVSAGCGKFIDFVGFVGCGKFVGFVIASVRVVFVLYVVVRLLELVPS